MLDKHGQSRRFSLKVDCQYTKVHLLQDQPTFLLLNNKQVSTDPAMINIFPQ
jgi:hypothetical protein